MHAATDWEDFLKRLYDLNNDGSQNTTEHTFQADYTTPIGKIHWKPELNIFSVTILRKTTVMNVK